MSFTNKVISVFGRDLLIYAVSIFTSVLIARNLGPEILGYWMILALIPGYAEAFARPKTDIASVYFIGKNIFSKEDVLFNLNIISLFFSLLFIIVYLLLFNNIYSLLFNKSNINLKLESFIILFQVPIQFLSLNYSYFHISQENTAVYNKMVIINAWSNSILALFCIIIFKLGIFSLLISTTFSSLLTLVYGRSQVFNTTENKGKLSFLIIKKMLNYSKYFYLSGILSQLQEQGTKTISIRLLNSNNISFLGQGQGIGKMLLKVTDAMNVMLFPRVSKSEENSSLQIICKAFKIAFIILIFGSLILYFSSEYVILFLYGKKFITSSKIIKILIPGIFLTGISSTLISYFNGSGKAKIIPLIQLFPIIFQLFAGYYLIKNYSLIGAAFSISLGMSCYGFIIIFLFIFKTKVNIKDLIPTYFDLKLILSLIINFPNIIFKKIK